MHSLQRTLIALLLVSVFCLLLILEGAPAESGSNAAGSRTADASLLLMHSAPVPAEPAPEERLADLLADAPVTETMDGPIGVILPPSPPVDMALPLPERELETPPEKEEKDARAPAKPYREAWALVTAYCPCSRCCGRHANGRTSSGTSAWKPGAAADPRAISYGTRIYVPGYGYTRVDDTGGAMRRRWRRQGLLNIDIRFTYHWQARRWGRRYMRIRVYDAE